MLNVSSRKRLLQVVLATFFNLTCAGVIFGFAALKPVLVKEGVYSDLCEQGDEDHVPEFGQPCDAQDLRLNYMFTLSTTTTNAIALPVGMLLDRVGPKYTTLLGATFFTIGNLVFPLNYRDHGLDTFFIGYICLAIGGPLIFLSSFHLSNTFPLKAGLILSCVTGAFDASATSYLLYDVIYARVGHIPLKAFFWSYAVIPALLVVFQLTAAPTASYQRSDFLVEPTHHHTVEESESPTINGDGEEDEMARELEANLNKPGVGDVHLNQRDRVVGVMFGKDVGEQLRSTWFLMIVLFLCIYMTRINYYIQTVFSQLLFFLGDADQARALTTAFTVLLPLGGLAGVPFVGFLLDKRTTFDASLVVMGCGLTYGVLAMTPSVPLQTIAISIFVFLRPLMYTFVGDYCGKVFGFATFGTVYGLTNSASGIFGLVLRPLDVFVKQTLEGDYVAVDVLFAAIGVVGSGMLSWKIWSGTRSVRLE